MRRNFIVLGLILALLRLPAAAMAAPRTAPDGSLVLEGSDSRQAKSADTLQDRKSVV